MKEYGNDYNVPGQMNIFEFMKTDQPIQPGDIIEDPARIGHKLNWNDAAGMLNQIILVRHDMQSHTYYKAVRPVESLIKRMKGYRLNPETGKYDVYLYDRLICENGHRYSKSLIDEIYYEDKLYKAI